MDIRVANSGCPNTGWPWVQGPPEMTNALCRGSCILNNEPRCNHNNPVFKSLEILLDTLASYHWPGVFIEHRRLPLFPTRRLFNFAMTTAPLFQSTILDTPGPVHFEGLTAEIVNEIKPSIVSKAHYRFLPSTPVQQYTIQMLKTFLGFTIIVPAPRFDPERDHFSHGFWGDRIGFLLETYEPNPAYLKAHFTLSSELQPSDWVYFARWDADAKTWTVVIVRKTMVCLLLLAVLVSVVELLHDRLMARTVRRTQRSESHLETSMDAL
ncbi:hypothetical protein HGRIS_000066 [Hohenbuehelia grisea]|uniref:Uncharacterized protein n=1 Tax=Hohenbuehelia grisea TaxID=104357 RepID=A0ABR3JRW6_9AGAR